MAGGKRKKLKIKSWLQAEFNSHDITAAKKNDVTKDLGHIVAVVCHYWILKRDC